jgi:hypothetical protein
MFVQGCGRDKLCYLYVRDLKTCPLCESPIVGCNRTKMVHYLVLGALPIQDPTIANKTNIQVE